MSSTLPKISAFSSRLFAQEGNLYAVLDAASIPDLLDKLYSIYPPSECLFQGDVDDSLAYVAPYLVELQADSPFVEWMFSHWGEHWGVFLTSSALLGPLAKHLRQFSTVHDERGRPLYFRFYDPRVLPVYLPTCTPKELSQFFGPVRTFYSESDDAFLAFSMDSEKLKSEPWVPARGLSRA